MIRERNGFTLIEGLVALAMAAMFLMVFSSTLLSVTRAGKEISSHLFRYRYLRPFFLMLEKDLRNMVEVTSVPFQGQEEECAFITFREQSLVKVSYRWKGEGLVREGEEEDRKELIPQVKKFRLEYAYRDLEKGGVVFLPFWLEDPYPGLPGAVKVSVEVRDKEGPLSFSKVILIPQGEWGILPSEP